MRSIEQAMIKNLRAFRDDLKSKAETLSKELEVIVRDLQALDQILRRYEGQTNLNLKTKSGFLPGTEYSRMGLREAVLEILRKNQPMGLKADDIKKALVEGGYRTNSDNLRGGVFAVLSVLRKDGIIHKISPGVYRFMEMMRVS